MAKNAEDAHLNPGWMTVDDAASTFSFAFMQPFGIPKGAHSSR